MILIEEILIDGVKFKFFDGLDFKKIIEHPKDGESGFIICYIISWLDEVTKYERDNKIDSILNESKFEEFKNEYIDNKYVSIYQLSGVDIDILHRVISQKVINRDFHDQPWIPISDKSSGALKIQNNKSQN